MIAFIVIFSTLTLIRFYYRIMSRGLKDVLLNLSEGPLLIGIRVFFSIPLFSAVASYILFPDLLPWSYISLPYFIRAAGILLGVLSIFLLYFSHRELGEYFSGKLVIKKGHALVTSGVYRFIRHPMYTAYFSLFIASFLISENWLIGLTGAAVITTLMTIRIGKEEALLLKYFEEDYENYMASTGKFLPKFSKPGLITESVERQIAP